MIAIPTCTTKNLNQYKYFERTTHDGFCACQRQDSTSKAHFCILNIETKVNLQHTCPRTHDQSQQQLYNKIRNSIFNIKLLTLAQCSRRLCAVVVLSHSSEGQPYFPLLSLIFLISSRSLFISPPPLFYLSQPFISLRRPDETESFS